MRRAVALCRAAMPSRGQNVVDELIGESVFGVSWTDTLEVVRTNLAKIWHTG